MPRPKFTLDEVNEWADEMRKCRPIARMEKRIAARDRFETKAKLEEWARRAGDGHHFGDRHHLMKYLDWKILLKDEAGFAEALEKLEGPKRYVKEIQDAVESDRRRRTLGR